MTTSTIVTYTAEQTAINGDTAMARITKQGRKYTVDMIGSGYVLVSRRTIHTSKKAAMAAASAGVEKIITDANDSHNQLMAQIASVEAGKAQATAAPESEANRALRFIAEKAGATAYEVWCEIKGETHNILYELIRDGYITDTAKKARAGGKYVITATGRKVIA